MNVTPYHTTNPNNKQRGNWSSEPNLNPFIGNIGTKQTEK